MEGVPIAINDEAPLKIVSMIQRDNPAAIIALGDSGIERPQDLEGKTVAYGQGGINTGELSIRELVAADGGDPDLVETTAVDPSVTTSVLEPGATDLTAPVTSSAGAGVAASNSRPQTNTPNPPATRGRDRRNFDSRMF